MDITLNKNDNQVFIEGDTHIIFVESIFNELQIKYDLKWVNKTNKTLICDYEPFCSDRYFVRYIIPAKKNNLENLLFAMYIIESIIEYCNTLKVEEENNNDRLYDDCD